MTVAAWLEDSITKALAASDRKQATKDLYATLARTHLVPTLDTIPLGRLRPFDVEALIVTKRGVAYHAQGVLRTTQNLTAAVAEARKQLPHPSTAPTAEVGFSIGD